VYVLEGSYTPWAGWAQAFRSIAGWAGERSTAQPGLAQHLAPLRQGEIVVPSAGHVWT